ncbi:unnamed protein product [Rhizophagus irregularis]|nr:unnamed protein product [Rhizophagus irregularis]
MRQCWSSNPSKRPSASEFLNTINKWTCGRTVKVIKFTTHGAMNIVKEPKELSEAFIQAEKKRLKLIRSKKLGPEFSQNSHSKAIFTSKPLSFLISKYSIINSSKLIQEYITKELDFDIDTRRLLLSNIQDSQESPKRNIEELKIDSSKRRKNG